MQAAATVEKNMVRGIIYTRGKGGDDLHTMVKNCFPCWCDVLVYSWVHRDGEPFLTIIGLINFNVKQGISALFLCDYQHVETSTFVKKGQV
jgi:hypothetical protein